MVQEHRDLEICRLYLNVAIECFAHGFRRAALAGSPEKIASHPMFDRTHPGVVDFIRESNRIEGILRDPTEDEIAAHEQLLGLVQLGPTTVGDFQAVMAPGMPIRRHEGMGRQGGQP
jgi:hypothetical protein